MIHDHMPRWFSGIIRPSGFLTQEFTSLSMGEVPRSIRGWGLFAAHMLYLGLGIVDISILRHGQFFEKN